MTRLDCNPALTRPRHACYACEWDPDTTNGGASAAGAMACEAWIPSRTPAEVSLLERLFGLAFKYRPVIFAQGELAFSPPWPAMLAVLAALAAAALAVWSYRRRSVPGTSTRARLVLLGLRLATIAVFLLCLLRPVLVLRAIEPQRNFLAVLVDDSRSMTIADDNASPRTAFIRDAFGDAGGLRDALARRFTLRYFRFSAATERAASADGGIVDAARVPTSARRSRGPPKSWPGCRCRASCC